MSELFNDKHLLWWIIKYLHQWTKDGIDPLKHDSHRWTILKAPEWVYPTLKEKIKIMEDEGGLD